VEVRSGLRSVQSGRGTRAISIYYGKNRIGFAPAGRYVLAVKESIEKSCNDFTRWPGSGPTVRISRRYVGVENGAMNRKVRLFGSINAVT